MAMQWKRHETDGEGCQPRWADLVPDVLVNIFGWLSLEERMCMVPSVCHSWRRISQDPVSWQKVDLEDWSYNKTEEKLHRMAELLINKARGRITHFRVPHLSSAHMLLSSSTSGLALQVLQITHNAFPEDILCQLARKFRAIRFLDISYCVSLSKCSVEAFARSCPHITGLILNRSPQNQEPDDVIAFVVSKYMQQVEHLEMRFWALSNSGLKSLLENCRSLEYLDLQGCRFVDMDEACVKEASKRLRVVYKPELYQKYVLEQRRDRPYEEDVAFLSDEEDVAFLGSTNSLFLDYLDVNLGGPNSTEMHTTSATPTAAIESIFGPKPEGCGAVGLISPFGSVVSNFAFSLHACPSNTQPLVSMSLPVQATLSGLCQQVAAIGEVDCTGRDENASTRVANIIECEWSDGDEKASTADEETEKDSDCRFSKVYPVNCIRGAWSVVFSAQQKTGSPSKVLCSKAKEYTQNILATHLILVSFLEKCNSQIHKCRATNFFVSPEFSITAMHSLQKKAAELDLREPIYGCVSPKSPKNFLSLKDMHFSFDVLASTMSRMSQSKPRLFNKGFFREGSDFGILQIINERSDHFLLPTSPFYDSVSNDGIAIFSFPAVRNFLSKASRQLLKGNEPTSEETDIWELYTPAMQREINHAIEEAKDEHEKTSMMQNLKIKLFNELHSRFKDYNDESYNMVVSVGKLRFETNNMQCIGNNASVLSGSSGGPVCPLKHPGYFIGIHSGGALQTDMNVATSTDNDEFVAEYMHHVLPTLPLPEDNCWLKRDLKPFKHWLERHRKYIAQDLSWHSFIIEQISDSGSGHVLSKHDGDMGESSSLRSKRRKF